MAMNDSIMSEVADLLERPSVIESDRKDDNDSAVFEDEEALYASRSSKLNPLEYLLA